MLRTIARAAPPSRADCTSAVAEPPPSWVKVLSAEQAKSWSCCAWRCVPIERTAAASSSATPPGRVARIVLTRASRRCPCMLSRADSAISATPSATSSPGPAAAALRSAHSNAAIAASTPFAATHALLRAVTWASPPPALALMLRSAPTQQRTISAACGYRVVARTSTSGAPATSAWSLATSTDAVAKKRTSEACACANLRGVARIAAQTAATPSASMSASRKRETRCSSIQTLCSSPTPSAAMVSLLSQSVPEG
mmetsp:Transcript_74753/g.198845  ORF Transcript_74753/g.198845 Transcript_74753/m.198845 type:complete len:255 (+) Transcript_74753:420-1184(+)